MTEQLNRIASIERRLALVNEFVERDQAKLAEAPNDFALEIALDSWLAQKEELTQELRLAKEEHNKEVIQFRITGRRMDGSIPIRLLADVATRFNNTISHAAFYLRHGTLSPKGIPATLSDELDLRLSGMAFGSTRLLFAGKITPDASGEALLESVIRQIFEILASGSREATKELVSRIGIKATKELSELLDVLEKQELGAELSWPTPDSEILKWGGTLADVKSAKSMLSVFKELKPELVEIKGRITLLNEAGSIYIKDSESHKYKIEYSKQQFDHASLLTLGQEVALKAMKYSFLDELSGNERTRLILVT
jgi:hypothetical protein